MKIKTSIKAGTVIGSRRWSTSEGNLLHIFSTTTIQETVMKIKTNVHAGKKAK